MKERFEILNYKYRILILTFLFFLVITALCPLSGEDLGYYLISKGNIFDNIDILDGRIITELLVPFFCGNKLLFNIAFSFLVSLFVYECNNALGIVKCKHYYLLPFLNLLLVSVFTFSYSYMSVSSTVTYTFPALLIFIYFLKIVKREDYLFKFNDYVLITLVVLYVSFSSVFIGLTFALTNFFFYLLCLKRKRNISNIYILILILQVLAVVTSFTFIDKTLFYNNVNTMLSFLPSYIDNVFSKNIVLVFLSVIPINYYLNDKLGDFVYKRVIITFFDAIVAFSIAYNFYYYVPVNMNLVISKYFGVFATENWYYIFYYLIYYVLYFCTIRHFVKSKKVKDILTILYLSTIFLNAFNLLSPMWDVGNTIYNIFFMILSLSVLFKDIEIKIYPKFTILLLTLLVLYYVSMFGVIKYIDETREDYIDEQVESKSKIVEVKANPLYLVWRYNPVNFFQEKDFKLYYDIPEDSQIEVKYFGVFEKIKNKVKE